MDETTAIIYERLLARYVAGEVPWDDELPPPEVIAYLEGREPGRALDLGCGYGRASIYMAGLGWDVDGVDFIQKAIIEASRRAREAGVNPRFHEAPVTELDFLTGPFDFALDVGCGHNLDHEGLQRYRDQLHRLLRPGGPFMLFARLREQEPSGDEEGPLGMDESRLRKVFEADFELTWMDRGETLVEDNPPWPSAWFRFRRL